MHTKLTIASLYVNVYGRRAAQTVKHNTEKVTKTVASHNKEVTVLAAVSSVVYLTSRAAGFKAGYEFAKTPIA